MSDRSGLFLHEGDIELTESQRKMIKTQISSGRQKRATLRSLSKRWMDSSGRPLIPYYIEGSVGEWVLIKLYSIQFLSAAVFAHAWITANLTSATRAKFLE